MLRDGSIGFAFKELRNGVFLRLASLDHESFDLNEASGILLDGKILVLFRSSEQVVHHLVVDLQIRNADSYLLLVSRLNLLEKDANASGDHASVFVVDL